MTKDVSKTGWPDYFSQHSADYRRYRPRYPRALFEWLARTSPARGTAWDCGTGNGQAAVELGALFAHVIATDPSRNQLGEAEPHPHVEYRVAQAEDCGLEDVSVDLVTVAQALHWFDLARFHDEVRRVTKPGGVIAEWAYGLMDIAPEIDRVVRWFYEDVVGRYWPPQRRHIENGYRDLPFPFAPIEVPAFAMEAEWSLAEVAGYVATWSPIKIYQKERGEDPLALLREPLSAAWGDPARRRKVVWPLGVRAGRV